MPIAGFQLVQGKLATTVAETTAMQLFCFRLAQLQEAGAIQSLIVGRDLTGISAFT